MATVMFMPGVFNETLALLFDAHHYFQSRGSEDLRTIGAELKLPYSEETMRITVRLTNVMAWLMVKRAIHGGREIPDHRLDGIDAAMLHRPEILEQLPYYLHYLSERSLELFLRVHRLDQMEAA